MMRNAMFPLSLSNYGSDEVQMSNARASSEPERPICYSGTILTSSQTCNSLQFRSLAPSSPSSHRNHSLPTVSRCNYPGATNVGKVVMNGGYVNSADSGACRRNWQYDDVASNSKKRSASTSSPSEREARMVEPRKRRSPHGHASETAAADQQQPKPPVRKSQKLGDKVNALQQLVSPFGKTDTASVLHEATVYIKLLQEQIQVLSMPYFKYRSFSRRGDDDDKFDLRSRGLCLVPVSSTTNIGNQEMRDSSIFGRTSMSPCLD